MPSSIDRLAARISAIETELRAQATTPQLKYSSIDDGALRVNDIDGTQTMVIGKQYDGTATAAVVNGPPPPQPSTPTSRPAVSGVVAIWDGTFADGSVAPMDFARVEVHVGPADMDPLTADYLRGTIESPRGGEVIVPVEGPDAVTIILVARSLSGKYSLPSTAITETPAIIDVAIEPDSITEVEIADDSISTPKLQALAVNVDKLAANAVTAAKIAANAVETDKLQANSITGSKLAVTIALASRFVSGGTVAADGTASGQRTELSPLGLQAYDAAGNVTFKVSNDGTAHTFSGSADIDYGRFSKGFSLGGAGEVAQGGTMSVASGVTAPSIPATVQTRTIGGGYVTEATPALHGGTLGAFPTTFNGSYSQRGKAGFGYVDNSTNSTYIGYWLLDTDGTFLGTRVAKFSHTPGEFGSALTWVSNLDFPGEYLIGFIQRSNVQAWLTSSQASSSGATITLNSNGNDGGGTVVRTYTRTNDTVSFPGFGWDSVNSKILITEWSDNASGAGKSRIVKRFGIGASPDGTTWTSAANVTRPQNNGPLAVHYGRFDFSEDCFVFSDAGGGSASVANVFPGTAGSSEHLGRQFPTSASGSTSWDGTVFRTALGYPSATAYTSPGYVIVHSTQTDESTTAPGYFPWWVGLSYVKTTSGTINYETVLGAKTRILAIKRGYLWIQTPVLPPAATNSPTGFRVYLAKETVASTSPADSAYRDDGLQAASLMTYHTPEAAVGVAPLATGTFPGGAGGSMFSGAVDGTATPLWRLAGDGSWRLGDMSANSAGLITQKLAACKVKRGTAWSTGAADAEYVIPWDSEVYDTHGFHDNTTNPSRLVVPAGLGGLYDVKASWTVSSALAAGRRASLRIKVNGAQVAGAETTGAGGYPGPMAATDLVLNAGDYVEASIYVQAGAIPLDIALSFLSFRRVGAVS